MGTMILPYLRDPVSGNRQQLSKGNAGECIEDNEDGVEQAEDQGGGDADEKGEQAVEEETGPAELDF